MTPDSVFQAANLTAFLGWLLLIASRWARTLRPAVTGVVVPVLLAVAYVIVLARTMPAAEGGFDTLAGVRALFENPWMVLAGWLHYLAFDLLVGTWIWFDGERKGLPWFATLPALLATFFFGPAGFLLHLAIRAALTRSIALDDPGLAR